VTVVDGSEVEVGEDADADPEPEDDDAGDESGD
jgi:hypothetical protein